MMRWFRLPKPAEQAEKELLAAELGLLEAYRHVENAQSYLETQRRRVIRLRAFLASPDVSPRERSRFHADGAVSDGDGNWLIPPPISFGNAPKQPAGPGVAAQSKVG